MILARKFTLAADNDYERIAAAGGRLRALLEAFTENTLPREYGEEQLAGYARSLLAVQRKDGSFASYSDPEKLDDDVRTDAHRFITWAALAFLCRLQDSREESLPGLEKGILAAMKSPAASDFKFPESGDAEAVQQVEAVLILSSGGIPRRLEECPSSAPEMTSALKGLKENFRRRLETGNTALPGGIEYEFLFRQALEGLEH